MPGPDTAVEEAPVLVALYLALVSMLAWIVLRGMRWAWPYSVGWLLATLGKLPKVGTWPVKIDLGKPFRTLNNDILNALESEAAKFEKSMGRYFHSAARLQLWIVDELYGMAKDVYGWASWLQKQHLPKWIKGVLDSLALGSLIAKLVHDTFGKQLSRLRRIIAGVVSEALHHVIPGWLHGALGAIYWLKDHWKVLAKVLAFAAALPLFPVLGLEKVFRGIDDLRKWRVHVNKRLGKLEAIAGATALAAVVANMTGTRISCWRGRGNIARALRHVCGVPSWLLDVLLVGVVEGFILSDLCGFSDLLIKEAEAIRPALLELVDVEDALIGCSGTVKPIAFDLAPLSLPPMYGPSALAA